MYNFANILRGGAVVARRAHNPKVIGSSPIPATTEDCTDKNCCSPFSFSLETSEIL